MSYVLDACSFLVSEDTLQSDLSNFFDKDYPRLWMIHARWLLFVVGLVHLQSFWILFFLLQVYWPCMNLGEAFFNATVYKKPCAYISMIFACMCIFTHQCATAHISTHDEFVSFGIAHIGSLFWWGWRNIFFLHPTISFLTSCTECKGCFLQR